MLNYQKVFGATEWGCFITGDGIPKLVERASGEAFDKGHNWGVYPNVKHKSTYIYII